MGISKFFKQTLTRISPKLNTMVVYWSKFKCPIDLKNPKTLDEKIQWLKLYDSTPIKTQLTDKYLVREWVSEKIGRKYLSKI